MKMMGDRCGDSEAYAGDNQGGLFRYSKLQQPVVSQCLLLMFAGQEMK